MTVNNKTLIALAKSERMAFNTYLRVRRNSAMYGDDVAIDALARVGEYGTLLKQVTGAMTGEPCVCDDPLVTIFGGLSFDLGTPDPDAPPGDSDPLVFG